MPFFLSPIANDQIFDSAGDPLVGGQVETYLAGSGTQAATYTSDTGLVQNSNPIILNALGYAPNTVWLSGGVAYKFIIKNADGAVLRTIDNVAGINDASVSQSEWVQSGLTPTYISATSFSLVGDQTAIFQVGRRLQTLNTSGLIYSTIATSTFGAGVTTITTVNDSGVLDLGLSQVSYGLLSADNSSFPFALLGPANTIALSDDGTTNAAHYLTFSDGTAGQENLKTDTAKLAYNPSTGLLSANISAASLTSGSVPDARLTQVIGVGQTWQNVAGSRSLGVFYTNSTGRPIVATVTIAAAATVGVQYFIGGTQFAATNVLSNLPQTFTFIVPNGVTYRVDTTSTILYWWELR